MESFLIHQGREIKDYYLENGYVVVEKLIPESVIDVFLKEYEKIKRDSWFVYYSQSIHRAIRPFLTPEGFIYESMLNPERLKLFPKFSTAIRSCLLYDSMSKALSEISGGEKHVMWQNMFFDLSTGTIEHQDHGYLDTDPPGHLIAAWYALEDIHPNAGCFFVLPGSHKGKVLERERYSSHEDFIAETIKLAQETSYTYKTFPLCKGDVLFWHPYTIHGAHKNIDPQYSRKSFTAHFYPLGFKRGENVQPKLKETLNPSFYTSYRGSDVCWSLKQYFNYFYDTCTKKNRKTMNMRRETYE